MAPNSPDLNPLDYHVWGALLEKWISQASIKSKNDKRIEGRIGVNMERVTPETHQQRRQKLYKETQKMCSYWWWTHWTHVVIHYQVCFATVTWDVTKQNRFCYVFLRYMFLNYQKTVGWLIKSGITFVPFEIFRWNVANICRYEWHLSLQNLIFKFLLLAKILVKSCRGFLFFGSPCI